MVFRASVRAEYAHSRVRPTPVRQPAVSQPWMGPACGRLGLLVGGLHRLCEACPACVTLASVVGGLSYLWEACPTFWRLAPVAGGLPYLWEA
jgi:hypothetical protein